MDSKQLEHEIEWKVTEAIREGSTETALALFRELVQLRAGETTVTIPSSTETLLATLNSEENESIPTVNSNIVPVHSEANNTAVFDSVQVPIIETDSEKKQSIPIIVNASSNQNVIPISTETSAISSNSVSDQKIDSEQATSVRSNIATTIETSAIPTPIVSASVQIVSSPSNVQSQSGTRVESWSQIVERDENQLQSVLATERINASDYVEDSEIEKRIQSEKNKLKLYASQIDRLRTELSIIEHQREIALLNLSLFEATQTELNSASEPPLTKSSAPSRKQSEKAVREQPSMSKGQRVQDNSDVQCYNCSDYGHYSDNCTKERRVKGSCFHCGSLSHMLKDCPSKTSTSGIRSTRKIQQKKSKNNSDSEWSD